MGVTGLWKLIEASGKPVPLETLENKVLAVDISIWLHQVVKGFQDNKGGALAHAHLLGLFHRLCKLLYYRIKPVFVFDGGVPQLKKETIAKRSQSRNKLLNEAERLQQLLLESLAKEKVVKQALGTTVAEQLKSPAKPKQSSKKAEEDDLFKLPDLPTSQELSNAGSSFASDITTDTDSSFDETNLRYSYQQNLQSIDVSSARFKNLPADVRHEILTDIKETRKQSSWGRLHTLPAKSDDFSNFQMKRLLKRRQVQLELEEAEKQMGGKSLTLNELRTFLSEEGVVTASKTEATRQIASDENTRYLLVRDLKKAIENAENKKKDEGNSESKESCVAQEDLGKEYDEDLELAMKLSLETSGVYKDDDYECDDVKMNRDQRRKLRSAISLARTYMIEYGGMNDDEIKELLEQTQILENEDLSASFNFQHNDKFILKGEVCTPYKYMKDMLLKKIEMLEEREKEILLGRSDDHTEDEKQSKTIEIMSSDSDNDSDLIEVDEKIDENKHLEPLLPKTKELEIVVDLTKEVQKEDDIFADIFEKNTESITLSNETNASGSLKIPTIKIDESAESESSSQNISQELKVVENNSDTKSIKSNLQDVITLSDNKKGMEVESNETSLSHSEQELGMEIRNVHLADKEEKMDVRGEEEENDNIQKLKEIGEDLESCENVKNKCDINKEDEIITTKEGDSPENASIIKKEQPSSSIKILAKLKEDLKSVSKITLNDIQIKEGTEAKLEKHNKNVSTLIKSNEGIQKHDPVAILEDLKQQASEVAKINLEDIKVDSKSNLGENPEIIEIPDDKPPAVGLHTSEKSKDSITNYFGMDYSIKRTPTKPPEEEEDTPKKPSPFFVNKTPKSSSEGKRKRQELLEEDEIPAKKGRKVSKMLFGNFEDNKMDVDIQPLDQEPIDAFQAAAQALKENKSREELEDIAKGIAQEKRNLELESNRQERMGMSISEKMNSDCMQLLRLFGVPYIVAPMEAEAQCAFLDAVKLTDGTITDDSDIWLFGGCTVYKNFFNQKKHVMEFKVDNIKKLYSIDRYKLIQLAILVGSDYTSGVNGIGTVTALEILAAFATTPEKEGETTATMSILSSLRKFRDWWKNGKTVGPGGKTALKNKLKNIELTEGFPNLGVVEAYMNPKIDDSRETFTWGKPDVESIREFCKKTFGWTRAKTDEILLPVLKKMNEKKIQMSIKNYFNVKSAISVKELKVSKRVQKAINRISGECNTNEEEEVKPKKTRSKRAKKTDNNEQESENAAVAEPKKTRKSTGKSKSKNNVPLNEPSTTQQKEEEGEKAVNPSPMKASKKLARMADTKIVIPQKEKELKEMEQNKEKAIEIFKKSQESKRGRKKR